MEAIQQEFLFDYGVTHEQACIMCHLSSECGGCCVKCRASGKNGSCYGQNCFQLSMEHDGQRWEAWLYLVGTSLPHLRKFVPRKYWKYIKQYQKK